VEQQDDLGLLQRLQPKGQHGDLDRDPRQKQKVVARERRTTRIPEERADDQRHHRAAEQARPRLLDAETDELVRKGTRWPLLGPSPDLRLCHDEAGERRPAGGCAGLGWGGWVTGHADAGEKALQKTLPRASQSWRRIGQGR
jgi:hypothetical protein